MDRSLICLCAMVKDEVKTFAKTLESVASFVDRAVLLDTGSTDGTQGLLRGFAEQAKFQVAVHEEPFVDFATTRNRVLALAGTDSVFTLFLSGDEVLVGGKELREFLEAHRDAEEGAYCVRMRSGSRTWPYTRVLRATAGWQYEGVVHERPLGPKNESMGPLIPGVEVVHTERDPKRKLARIKNFDLPTLTKIVEDESLSTEQRARDMFFLAETHAVLAAECKTDADLSHNFQAMALYQRYAQVAMGEKSRVRDVQKALYAQFLFYHIAEKVGLYTSAEFVPRLAVLIDEAPDIAEAYFLYAKHVMLSDPEDQKGCQKRGLFLAEEGAKKARELSGTSIDSRTEWLCYRLGIACALGLGRDKDANHTDRARYLKKARELADKALLAGAEPKDVEPMFQDG